MSYIIENYIGHTYVHLYIICNLIFILIHNNLIDKIEIEEIDEFLSIDTCDKNARCARPL